MQLQWNLKWILVLLHIAVASAINTTFVFVGPVQHVEQILYPGNVCALTCLGNGTNVTWIVPNEASEDFYQITNTPSESTIVINYKTIEDPAQTLVGYYYCVDTELVNERVRHEHLQQYNSFYVFLNGSKVKLAGPWYTTIEAVLGEKVWLPCRSANNESIQIQLEDQLNLNEIFTSDPHRGIEFHVKVPDSFQDYTCTADDESTVGVTIKEIKAPGVPAVIADNNGYGLVNGKLTLYCSVDMDEEFTYHWRVPNKITEIPEILNKKQLVLSNLTKAFEGAYICIVNNPKLLNFSSESSINVHVSDKPFINIWEPANLNKIVIALHEPLRIAIHYVGSPSVESIRWKWPNGEEIIDAIGSSITSFQRIEENASVLDVDRLESKHFGQYTIMADNGVVQKEFTIDVQMKKDQEVESSYHNTILYVLCSILLLGLALLAAFGIHRRRKSKIPFIQSNSQ